MSKWKRWSEQQDLILMENSNKGAAWCAKEIGRRFGVRRTEESTRRHGTRLGCSWKRYEICPECGKPILSMPRQLRMCRDCNEKRLRDEAKKRYEKAVANSATDGSGIEFEQVRREYDKYRQRKRRA